MRLTGMLVLLLPAAVGGCDTGTQSPQEVASTRTVMRGGTPVPPGAVPQGAAARAAALAAPGPDVSPDLLAHGRERYRAFCSPCHGIDGHGKGTVTRNGYPAPPSLHRDQSRTMPPEEIVSVVTHGRGLMYPFGDRITPQDTWAVARFVKELQAAPPPPPAPEEPPAAAVVSPATPPWLPFLREKVR
jgi:mono/diheme cytochrome c family protein